MEAVLSSSCEDDAAMRRVAQGDSDSLAWLFDQHKARVFAFLCHLVGDRALAEDLLGETFLRVYQARGAYRSGAGFRPWLFRIARNLALGELRRKSVRKRAVETLGRLAQVEPGWEPDPEAALTRERVRDALQALPEEQRAALFLKEYEGLEYREIAAALGCTEQAARARTYRARQALRESLQDWYHTNHPTPNTQHPTPITQHPTPNTQHPPGEQ